jgi:DNA-binding transcriptional LysR family regulator
MNDLQIKYFLNIVNSDLNFTKASKGLFVSQPALSKHIRNLEKDLEVKLFDTSVKSAIRLTLAGERFYRFFTGYVQDFTKAIKEAKIANNQLSGEIKIAVPSGWTLSYLSKQFDGFQSKYPNINIILYSVEFKAIERGIQNNSYDLAITGSFHFETFKQMENIYIDKICTIPIILLYSSKHPLAGKKDLTITDFKDDVLYALSAEETLVSWIKDDSYCKSKGFIPKMKTAINIDSILLAIDQGSGYTLLDQWQRVRNHPSFKYLNLDIEHSVVAVWKKDNSNTALNLFLTQGLFR